MASTVGKISNRVLSVMAGMSAFVLTLLGFLLLGSLNQQVVASLMIGLFALMVVHLAAERPNSAHARALAALIDRLLAVGRGDLASPAPAALKREMPALAAAVEGLFAQVRSNLDDAQAMAMYDPVTSLPNRVHFRREAERILASRHTGAALLFIDLDGFKEVNDRLGHAQGDQVLVMVANRLRVVLKAEVAPGTLAPPLLARLAGDEFTMLLPEVSSREEAERIATGALAALAEPFKPAGQSVLIGGSIGIALAPEHGTDLTALMKAADIAMYQAKACGRSRLCSYEPSLARASEERSALEASVRGAVERHELELVFEPRLCLRTGAITAAEAQIRWNGEGGSRLLSADDTLLQEAGLAVRLGDWTLDAVAGALGRWRAAGLDQRLCFPVAARQFERLDFIERLRGVLTRAGSPPWGVEIELDEAAASGCDKWVVAELERLSGEGVEVCVSDFGSGRARLSGFANLPMNRVRLDRGIVAEIDRSERARSVAASLIHLVHGLGCEAVAAGVDRQDQVEVLRALGCDGLQGFPGVAPMPEDAFLAWADAQDCARSLVHEAYPSAALTMRA
ncbi:MAG TPA: EAL domain-containing protein [Allosphingosinicella sp.]|nr:EAL domain-containing protein [Allosphingosinicella sp.]